MAALTSSSKPNKSQAINVPCMSLDCESEVEQNPGRKFLERLKNQGDTCNLGQATLLHTRKQTKGGAHAICNSSMMSIFVKLD